MFIEIPVLEPSSPSGAQCSWSFISKVTFPGRLGRSRTFRPARAWDFYGGTLAINIPSLRDQAGHHRSCQKMRCAHRSIAQGDAGQKAGRSARRRSHPHPGPLPIQGRGERVRRLWRLHRQLPRSSRRLVVVNSKRQGRGDASALSFLSSRWLLPKLRRVNSPARHPAHVRAD